MQYNDNDEMEPVEAGMRATPISVTPSLPTAMYWDYLECLDLSDAEKTMLLDTLWTMMIQLVDLGFRGDPLPRLLPPLVNAAKAEELMATDKAYFRQFRTAARKPKPGGCA